MYLWYIFLFFTCGWINIFFKINVVDSGILGIFCFEVYVLLKCENLCRRIGKEHWILFALYEICRFFESGVKST